MRSHLFTSVAIIGVWLHTLSASAQIVTYTLEKGQAKTRLPQLNQASVRPQAFNVSRTEIQALLDDDNRRKQTGGYPYRFGKAQKADLGLKDGTWFDTPGGRVWILKISSPEAYSLNFFLNKFRLARGAELTIYNEDRSMQMGPITDALNTPENVLVTDLLSGSAAIFELFEPDYAEVPSVLHISNVVLYMDTNPCRTQPRLGV